MEGQSYLRGVWGQSEAKLVKQEDDLRAMCLQRKCSDENRARLPDYPSLWIYRNHEATVEQDVRRFSKV